MDGFNVAQFVVSVVAALLIGPPLLVLSYLAGRRSQSNGHSIRLDQLQPDVNLGGSTWTAQFGSTGDSDERQTVQYQFQQIGCRILAHGNSAGGARHTLEGVLHRGCVCTLAIDETREGS